MWTLPNILTIGRLAAAPLPALVFAFLDDPAASAWACALFVVAAATDWVDGWLARRTNQISAVGKMLDPIADKALVSITLAAIVGLYGLDWTILVPVAAILLRETLIAGLREHLGGRLTLPVTRLAKVKTAAQMTAIALLLGAGALSAGGAIAAHAGGALLWVAAILTLVTGWDYLTRGIAALRADDIAAAEAARRRA
jgi:CDP-diacylglycerol--glycerol-3-phosphate 3-phosphatidyltransferase